MQRGRLTDQQRQDRAVRQLRADERPRSEDAKHWAEEVAADWLERDSMELVYRGTFEPDDEQQPKEGT